MPLPTLETPKYTLTLPSTKQKIEYRPFLVKEEKILLLAQQSEDSDTIFRAMIDIVDACTFNKLLIDKLSNVDLEFIFLKLRARSVGETVDLNVFCDKCEEPNQITIDIDDIKVKYSRKKVDPTIQLTEDIGVVCTYPTVKALMRVKRDNPSEIISCVIESIYDSETTYNLEDETPEEINKFIDTLNMKQLSKIQEFIQSVPKIQHTVKFECSKCNHKNSKLIQGAESFFA
jgi:predicted house-cleaning noncanonical NTP pyrophosphatase (MazG superfamily)